MSFAVTVRNPAAGTVETRIARKPELDIGRDPRSDLWLDHESVSPRHARVVERDGKLIVVDLRSGTGIRIRRVDDATDKRISSPHVVGGTDTMGIGPFFIVVEHLPDERDVDWPLFDVRVRDAVDSWEHVDDTGPAADAASFGLWRQRGDPDVIALGLRLDTEPHQRWLRLYRSARGGARRAAVLDDLGALDAGGRSEVALSRFRPSVSARSLAAATRGHAGRAPVEAVLALGRGLADAFGDLAVRAWHVVERAPVAERVLLDFSGGLQLWPAPVDASPRLTMWRLAAPEHLTGDAGPLDFEPLNDRALGPPALAWAVGALLFEVWARHRVFEVEPADAWGWDEHGAQAMGELPERARAEILRMPAPLAEVVSACLVTDPLTRPSLEDVGRMCDGSDPRALTGFLAALMPEERARQEAFLDELAMLDPSIG